jgi:L-lactate dehydrogenase (cytochrome)
MERIPKFAFDYLDGGCNEDVNLHRNSSELKEVQLRPEYLQKFEEASLESRILGIDYDAPFGIAPIGLQGLIWPNSAEILAQAAFTQNIPFVLSTVSTSSIERISEITEGKAWFQLYHPSSQTHTDNLLERAEAAGCPVLVILCDVPTFGFRPRDIQNGLAMPPKMSIKNLIQMLGKPKWVLETMKHGIPSFASLKPYQSKAMNMKQLGIFMDQMFSGRLDADRIKRLRDKWKGKLVIKGIASENDAEQAVKLGLDGIIISNHGGRQLDAGQSTINAMGPIVKNYGDKIEIMMDSGLSSGPDIARTLASGAKFTFLGRPFMYGTAALGSRGGQHTISLLKAQLQQVMEQLSCEKVEDLHKHLVK